MNREADNRQDAAHTVLCVMCPEGCEIVAHRRGEELRFSRDVCRTGREYAEMEIRNPSRVLTSTVPVRDGEIAMLPVRTAAPVARPRLRAIMEEIKLIRVDAPVRIGDVVANDLAGTGVALVAGRTVARRPRTSRPPRTAHAAFTRALEESLCPLRRAGREVILFHHNDTDGLASGAILSTAFSRAGYTVDRYALEKPYPELLDIVFRRYTDKIVVFADFAGRIAPLIARKNQGRNLVVILDHHPAEPSRDPTVLNLDPDLYGLKGDIDISGSTTCYRFAVQLDKTNRDLAHLALLGATGDGSFAGGRLVSANRDALAEAERQGNARAEPWDDDDSLPGAERYFITVGGVEYRCDELASQLDTLGAVGYYQGGADLAVRVCLEGPSEESRRKLDELVRIRDRIFAQTVEALRDGALHTSEFIQWFDVKDRFVPMGVKMIGVFCDEIRNSSVVDPARYLAGFQWVPGEIPGLGTLGSGMTKVSMRVSDELVEAIRSNRQPGLDSFLPEATLNLGGFADACHSVSAATTIGIGLERELVEEAERVLAARIEELNAEADHPPYYRP